MFYFLFFLIAIYTISISVDIYRFIQINMCLYKLNKFINCYRNSRNIIFKDETYKKYLKRLLSYYPVISKYSSCKSLSYNISDEANCLISENIFADLLMKRNYQKFEILNMFNPYYLLKKFFSFPLSLLSSITKRNFYKHNFLINCLGWILSTAILYLLEMFQPEIKSFFLTLLENFNNTQK